MLCGLLAKETTPENPDKGTTLQQSEIEWNAGNRTGRKADNEIASIPRHAPYRRLSIITAYGVVDNIHPFSASDLFDAIFHRLIAVVDDFVGAQLLTKLQLFIGARCGNDCRPHNLTQLNRRTAHTTGSAHDKQGLTGFELAALLERVVRGKVSHPHARRR